MGKAKPQSSSKGGMYTLHEEVDMKAKVASLARRLEDLEVRRLHDAKAVNESSKQVVPCSICQSYEHLVDECPTIPVVREMFVDQANTIGYSKPSNNVPYGNKYNSSWRNHPNLSWKQNQTPYTPNMQAPPQTSSVEQAILNLSKAVGDFVGEQRSINNQLNQRIDNVETTFNKRMDGLHSNITQKIDNMQLYISKLTNLHAV